MMVITSRGGADTRRGDGGGRGNGPRQDFAPYPSKPAPKKRVPKSAQPEKQHGGTEKCNIIDSGDDGMSGEEEDGDLTESLAQMSLRQVWEELQKEKSGTPAKCHYSVKEKNCELHK